MSSNRAILKEELPTQLQSFDTPQGMAVANKTLQHKLRKQEAGERIFTSEPYKYGKYKGQPWSRLPNNLLLKISKESAGTIDGYTADMVLEHRGVQEEEITVRPTLHAIDRFSTRYLERYMAYREVDEMGMATFISKMCAEAIGKGEQKYDEKNKYYTYTHLGAKWVVMPREEMQDEQKEGYTLITVI